MSDTSALSRRALLRGAAYGAAGIGGAALLGDPVAASAHARPRRHGRLLWAANFCAKDSDGAGFGNVQIQYGGEDLQNGGPPIPIVNAPYGMGRAGKIHMVKNQERWEAEPQHADNLYDGLRQYFRFDFALAPDYPLGQQDSFCLLNQIHHAGDTASPPLEFDVYNNQMSIRGGSNSPSGLTYEQHVIDVVRERRYSVVYGCTFGSTQESSVIDVWVDGVHRVRNFHPVCSLTYGQGPAYWKGMTMYCRPSIPPLTVYENGHATGTSYASVACR